MVNFSLEERIGSYKVLLYSENPQAINILKKRFEKENINLVVKTLQHKEIFTTDTKSNNTNSKNYLLIIYDFTQKSVDRQKTLLQAKEFPQNLVFLFKTPNSQRQNRHEYKNKTIIIEDASRPTMEKVSDYLVKHLTDKQNWVCVFTNKNKSKRFYTARNVLLSFFLTLVFTPYLLTLFALVDDLLLNSILFSNVDVGMENKIISVYTKELGAVNTVVGFYKSIPLFGSFYNKTSEVSSNYYSRSLYMQKTFDRLFINNCFVKEFFLNNSIESKRICDYKRPLSVGGAVDITNSAFLKTENLLEEVDNIQKHMQQIFGWGVQNYIAVVIQEGGSLTPTGTSPQKIYLYKISNGRYEMVESFTQEYLKDKFRGSVSGVSKLNNFDIFEGVLDIKDKYLVYGRAINEIFDINISGIVFFENSNKRDFEDIKNKALQKKINVKESVLLYEKGLRLIRNGMAFYFPNGGVPVTNESVFWEYPSGACADNKISFIETTENLDSFKSGGVEMKGERVNEKLLLAIYYKNDDFVKDASFIIKSSKNISFIPEGGSGLTQEIIYKNDFEYLISKPNGDYVDGAVARYYLLPSGCGEGYVFRVDKQIGNDRLKLNYDIRTQKQFYLYIDRSLTGRGNKFYNDGSLYLNKDFLFKLVD